MTIHIESTCNAVVSSLSLLTRCRAVTPFPVEHSQYESYVNPTDNAAHASSVAPNNDGAGLFDSAMTHLSLEEAIAREITCHGYGDGLWYSRVCANDGNSDNLHHGEKRGKEKMSTQDPPKNQVCRLLYVVPCTVIAWECSHAGETSHRLASQSIDCELQDLVVQYIP